MIFSKSNEVVGQEPYRKSNDLLLFRKLYEAEHQPKAIIERHSRENAKTKYSKTRAASAWASYPIGVLIALWETFTGMRNQW